MDSEELSERNIYGRARRFYRNAEPKDGCLIWQGGRRNDYGSYKGDIAHRWIYDFEEGIEDEDNVIHHECGNKLCVNPNHLKEVTVREHRHLHANEVPPVRVKRKPLDVGIIRAIGRAELKGLE